LPKVDEERTQLELKSEIERLQVREIGLHKEFAIREMEMLRIQNELESKIKRFEQKQSKVPEQATSMRVHDSQRQVLSDFKLDNERLGDKETERPEGFAIRESDVQDIHPELEFRIQPFEQKESKLQEEASVLRANDFQKQVLYDLKSENASLKDKEIKLREEFATREANLWAIQIELEFKIKQLEGTEGELREEGTSMQMNDPQKQVMRDLKSENERLRDREIKLREQFAIQEANMQSLQNEFVPETNRLKHTDAKIGDELAANMFEHRRIQDELEIQIKSLNYQESEPRKELAMQGFYNQDHIEITRLRSELTSTKEAHDSQIRNLQNEFDNLKASETRLQNELTSARAAQESQKRDLQDELETANGRERDLRKQPRSKGVADSSEIQYLRNKLEFEELRHAQEVARLKEMVRYQNTSSVIGQQAAEESFSSSKEGRPGAKSLQQELSPERELKHILEDDIMSSLSKPKGLPPTPPESQPSSAFQFAPITSPTEERPEWSGSPWDAVQQTVPYRAAAPMGLHPAPTYNPGIPAPVSHSDRQSRYEEPHYESPSHEQIAEIQNAPSQESGSAENLPNPPPTSSLSPDPIPFLYPTSSQEVSYQSYGTETPVPETPNRIPGSGHPFPLSISSSTDSRHYLPGPQIPVVGSRGSERKPTDLQMQKLQPENFPKPQTAAWVQTVRSSVYQISESSYSYTYSKSNDKQRNTRVQSEVSEYNDVENKFSTSQNQPHLNNLGIPEHEAQEEETETEKKLAIVEVPKPATPLLLLASSSPTTPGFSRLGGRDDVQEYTHLPPIASLSHTCAGQVTTVPSAAAPNPYSSPQATIIAPPPNHSGYATSENTTASHSYSNLSETNHSLHLVARPTGRYHLGPKTTRTIDNFFIPQTTSTGTLEQMAYDEEYPMECHSESPSQLLSGPSSLPLITRKIIREGPHTGRTNPNAAEMDPCSQAAATTKTYDYQSPGRPLLEYQHIHRQMSDPNEDDDSEDRNDDYGKEYNVDEDKTRYSTQHSSIF